MIKVSSASGGYGNVQIIKNMSFEVERGKMFGIIGPNGSGKTTLLKMLSKTLPLTEGKVSIQGKDISAYSPKTFAKLVAVLPQQMMQTYSYTVRETVSLGRYAHQSGLFKSETAEDERVISQVMDQTGVKKYEHVHIDKLSGGERQRVFLAQALAQEPRILLLDEPTNHLDLSYQKELLDVLKKWTREQSLTVVAIFHDLNLAGLYCDKLMLMNDGQLVMLDRPDQVLKKQEIEEVYQADIEQHPHPKVARPQMLLVPNTEIDKQSVQIDEKNLHIDKEYILVQTQQPLKTMSSGITGSGVGWHRNFINRQIDDYYDCDDYKLEMEQYLRTKGFRPDETVSMMTAVNIQNVAYQQLKEEDFSMFVMATAAAGNAVDASLVHKKLPFEPGTVNLWIFVNGNLTDQAFIQGMTTATEAKVKAFHDLKIKDKQTQTFATGTPTDSISIAGTQQGNSLEFAGTATKLGKLIAKGVYDCVSRSLKKYFQETEHNSEQ